MARNRESILKTMMSNIGLFENMLGKYGDKILYDQKREQYKRFLYQLYGKKDTYELFPEEVDKQEYNTTLKTLFTYYEQNEGDIAKK